MQAPCQLSPPKPHFLNHTPSQTSSHCQLWFNNAIFDRHLPCESMSTTFVLPFVWSFSYHKSTGQPLSTVNFKRPRHFLTISQNWAIYHCSRCTTPFSMHYLVDAYPSLFVADMRSILRSMLPTFWRSINPACIPPMKEQPHRFMRPGHQHDASNITGKALLPSSDTDVPQLANDWHASMETR